jgi:hypothetical protein
MNTPPEITDLDLPVDANENIFWFNVSMHDVFLMQVLQSSSHLGDVLSGFPFRKALFLSKMFVQLSLPCELEDKEDSLAVVEVTVQTEDVRMAEVGLDFDLAAELLLDFTLLELGLVEDFQGTDKSGGSFFGEVHSPELALSEGFADFEHTQVEFLRRCELCGVERV